MTDPHAAVSAALFDWDIDSRTATDILDRLDAALAARPELDADHAAHSHYAQTVACEIPGCPLDWRSS